MESCTAEESFSWDSAKKASGELIDVIQASSALQFISEFKSEIITEKKIKKWYHFLIHMMWYNSKPKFTYFYLWLIWIDLL